MLKILSIVVLSSPPAPAPGPSEHETSPGELPPVALPVGVTEITPVQQVPTRVEPPPIESMTAAPPNPPTTPEPATAEANAADVPRAIAEAEDVHATPQPADAGRYVAPKGRVSFSGFGGLRMRPSAVGRYFGLFFGGAGGMVAGKFYIGGAGYGMFRDFGDYRLSTGEELELSIGYGGLLLGGEVFSVGPFSLGVQGLLGAGSACLSFASPDADDPACFDSTSLFIAEPELQARLRIARPLRIGLNLGYRFVVNSEWLGPSHFQLAGVTGALVVDFGWF